MALGFSMTTGKLKSCCWILRVRYSLLISLPFCAIRVYGQRGADGFTVRKMKGPSVWPLSVTLLNLPSWLRHRDCGLWVCGLLPTVLAPIAATAAEGHTRQAPTKEHFAVFLAPLLAELALLETGMDMSVIMDQRCNDLVPGVNVGDNAVLSVQRLVRAHLLFASADYRALPCFSNQLMAPNLGGCGSCEHVGVRRFGTAIWESNFRYVSYADVLNHKHMLPSR